MAMGNNIPAAMAAAFSDDEDDDDYSSDDGSNIISEMSHKNVNFICINDSITNVSADVVIVSSNPQYAMDYGASRAVSRSGGQLFWTKRDQAIQAAAAQNKDYITIETHDIPTLSFDKVIVIPIRRTNRSSIRVIYRQALKAAIDTQMDSICMPLLGCGGFHIPIDQAIQELVEAIMTFTSFGNISTIKFVDLSEYSMERLGDLLDTIPDALPDINFSNASSSSSVVPPLPTQSQGSISFANGQVPAPVIQPRHAIQYVGTAVPLVDPNESHMNERTKAQLFAIVARDEVAKNVDNSSQGHPCSICLNDLITSAGNGEEDDDSLKNDPVVRLKHCPHEFHKSCIEYCFEKKKQCPLCMRFYAPSFGTQPLNATMRVKRVPGNPPGHPTADGWFNIKYVIPSGIQTANHIRPGVPYPGTTRVTYLPNDEEGRHILRLLRKAFEHRHIFTVGDSVTTGAQNVPVWVVHHKTSMNGGPANYGFPDPEYYLRVTQELHDLGITSDMLDD